MDVSHGSLGQSDILSIAAVISSRQWPLISHRRASVSTQSLNFEMIDSLIKHMSDTKDNCIFKELMLNFYVTVGMRSLTRLLYSGKVLVNHSSTKFGTLNLITTEY